MTEYLNPNLDAAGRIANIWLANDDEEDITKIKAQIRAVREEYRQEHPYGNYLMVLRDARDRVAAAKSDLNEIATLTPEDFHDQREQ